MSAELLNRGENAREEDGKRKMKNIVVVHLCPKGSIYKH